MTKVHGFIALLVIILLALLISINSVFAEHYSWNCPDCGRTGNTGNYCGGCGHPAPWISIPQATTISPSLSIGDIIQFGHYEQDGNIENGAESIEWYVLDFDERNKKVFLISRYVLDWHSYYFGTINSVISWENSTLRNWLNNDFINTAFSNDEQKAILVTDIDDSLVVNTTQDKLFLLSLDEVNELLPVQEDRMCLPTDYAIQKRAYLSKIYQLDNRGTTKWWLRSTLPYPTKAGRVSINGSVNYDFVPSENGVRPAMWISLTDKK